VGYILVYIGAVLLFAGITCSAASKAMKNEAISSGEKLEDWGLRLNFFGAGIALLGAAASFPLGMDKFGISGLVAIVIMLVILLIVLFIIWGIGPRKLEPIHPPFVKWLLALALQKSLVFPDESREDEEEVDDDYSENHSNKL